MKVITLKDLTKIFNNQLKNLEQDDIPKKLKELRIKYKKEINKLNYYDKLFFLEDDNWF